MKQRKGALSDRNRSALLVAVLLFIGSAAHAQSFTATSAWGYDWNAGKFRTLLAIPADTFAVPAAFQNLPFIARKNGKTFYWDISAHRWDVDTSSGSSGGGGTVDVLNKQNYSDTSTYDATRWWVLSQHYTPLLQFQDSITALRMRMLVAGDTAWIHQQIANLQNNSAANSNLIFSDGLVWSSVDNHVRAQFASPIWDANRIQSISVSPVMCNGCVPFLDSANQIIRWGAVTTGGIVPAVNLDSVGWYAKGPYLRKLSGGSGVVRNLDSAEVSEDALRTLIESYMSDGTVVTGPDLSIDSAVIRGNTPVSGGILRRLYLYRSSGRIDSTDYIDYTGSGSSTTYTTTDPNLDITGTVISSRTAWNRQTVSGSYALDVSHATGFNNHVLTLSGNTTLSITGTPQDGQIMALRIKQDATGSRLVTWPAAVDWSATPSETAPTLKTGGGKQNFITLQYDATAGKWYGIY